jgi:hypothetical protein
MSTLMTLGAPEEKDGKLYIKVSKTSAGCVVWGPYQHLHQGTYSVQFEIAPEDSADAGAICCKIDIVADLGKSLIFERSLSARELRESGHVIDVKFSIQHASLVEYRIWTTGTAELRVAYDRMATAIPGETDFAYSSLNRQKWLLLFNCQTFGLTNCMNSLQDVVRVDGIDIWKYTNDIPHITAMLPAYDLVIIEPGFLRIPGADFGRAREILQLPSMSFLGFIQNYATCIATGVR